MPFTALYKGNTINSLLLNSEKWDELKASEQEYRKLKCPECEEIMIARAGAEYKISPHFAHRSDLIENAESDSKPCSLKSESSEHLYIKQWAFTECQSLGLLAEIEKRIPTDNGFQIADVCVPDKHKILEVQVSTQTEEKYLERHDAYSQTGYETLWITWKKEIPELPSAKISIQSKGKVLKNRKNIITAEQFSLLTPVVYFNEPKWRRTLDWEDLWGHNIDTIDKSVSLFNLIKTFMFEIERYEVSCSVCHKPHWCGQRCTEIKPMVETLIIKSRREQIDEARSKFPEIYSFLSNKYRSQLQAYLKGEESNIGELIEELVAEWNEKKEVISEHRNIMKAFQITNPKSYKHLQKEYPRELELYLNGEDNDIPYIIDDLREQVQRKEEEQREGKRLKEMEETEKGATQTVPGPLHDLSVYAIEDFRRHFNGEAYDHSMELDLKYTHREIYNAARIAHENRMWGLKRGMPTVCRVFLENLKN